MNQYQNKKGLLIKLFFWNVENCNLRASSVEFSIKLITVRIKSWNNSKLNLHLQWLELTTFCYSTAVINARNLRYAAKLSCDNRTLQIFSTFDVKRIIQKVKLPLILHLLPQLLSFWCHLGMYLETWKSAWLWEVLGCIQRFYGLQEGWESCLHVVIYEVSFLPFLGNWNTVFLCLRKKSNPPLSLQLSDRNGGAHSLAQGAMLNTRPPSTAFGPSGAHNRLLQ